MKSETCMHFKIYVLVEDEVYDWKGESVQLYAGDTFFGGVISPFPATRDYQVVRGGMRIWFYKETVETCPDRFRQLFV